MEPYNEPSATDVTFGFGRRVCPGKVLADSSLFLTFVQSLAVFDIRKAIDQAGKEINTEHRFGCGIISHPEPFEVRVILRSAGHARLIEQVLEEYPWQNSDAQHLDSMEVR